MGVAPGHGPVPRHTPRRERPGWLCAWSAPSGATVDTGARPATRGLRRRSELRIVLAKAPHRTVVVPSAASALAAGFELLLRNTGAEGNSAPVRLALFLRLGSGLSVD